MCPRLLRNSDAERSTNRMLGKNVPVLPATAGNPRVAFGQERHDGNPAARCRSKPPVIFIRTRAFQACCQRCGRFVIIALCDLQLGAEHVCPTCFERGRAQSGPNGGKAEWRYRDVLYDSIVLSLGWGWIIVWPLIVVALPAAIVFTREISESAAFVFDSAIGLALLDGLSWLRLASTAGGHL